MAKISKLPKIQEKINKYFGLQSTKDYLTTLFTTQKSEQAPPQPKKNETKKTPNTKPLDKLVSKFIDAILGQAGGKYAHQVAKMKHELTQGAKVGADNVNMGTLVASNIQLFLWDKVSGIEGAAPGPYIKEILGKLLPSSDNTPAQPSDTTNHPPLITVMFVKDNRISPAVRQNNAIALFLNAIPTIEFSRAIPFLDIEVLSNRPAVNQVSKKLATLSLYKFLEGAKKIEDPTELVMAQAGSVEGRLLRDGANVQKAADRAKSDPDNVKKILGSSGMEMFLSPQTLVGTGGPRSTPIIDQYRPFLSISSFDVQVVSAAGIMSYKSGKLNVILHDRSRLHEVADLVNPDLYGQVELFIQYGWSHPIADPEENVFGALINEFQAAEKYGISNSSFNFDDTGQVNIELQIYMKGGRELGVGNIMEDPTIRRLGDFIRDTKRVIMKLQQKAGLTEEQVKAIGGSNFLDGSERVALSLTTALQTQYKALLAKFTAASSDANMTALKKELKALYGEDGKPGSGKVGEMTARIDQIYGDRLKIIKKGAGNLTRDPFLVDGKPDKVAEGKIKGIGTNGTVSLAKLLLVFVGYPLKNAAQSRFDEIQFIYYNFNDNSAGASNTSIGSFRISVNHFDKMMKHIQDTRQSTSMQIGEFIGLINAEFISSMASATYELGSFYERKWSTKEKSFKTKQKSKSKGNKAAIFNAELEQAFRDKGNGSGTFSQPDIGFHVETVPMTPIEGQPASNADQKSILRIHVFDRTNSPYATENQLLRANDSSGIAKMIRDYSAAIPGHTSTEVNRIVEGESRTIKHPPSRDGVKSVRLQRANALIQEAKYRGILTQDEKTKKYSIVAHKGQAIKELIMNSVPTIIYGSNATAVKKASLSSLQDPSLNTIHMMGNDRSGWTDPEGSGPMRLPLRMIPTMLDLELFGCPLLDYMQEFFVDFRTGTTVDGIYQVSEVTHSIAQGKYDTSAKLINIDQYGKYESVYRVLEDAMKAVENYEKQVKASKPADATPSNDESASPNPKKDEKTDKKKDEKEAAPTPEPK